MAAGKDVTKSLDALGKRIDDLKAELKDLGEALRPGGEGPGER